MRRMIKTGILILAASCIFTGTAQAKGIGFMVGSGSESWDYDTGLQEDRSNSHFSFMYDTNVADDRLYGYRITIGSGSNTGDGGGLDSSGLVMTHTFAFQVAYQQMFKFWIGPQIKITSYDTHDDQGTLSYDGTVTGFGVGPAFGFNLNFQPPVSLNFTAGLLSMNYFGFVDVYSNGVYQYEGELDAEATGTFIDVAVIYRFGG